MSHAELNRRIQEGLKRAEQKQEFVWSKQPIEVRWRKNGWIPPSELPEYQAKWKHYRDLAAKDQ